MSRSLLTKEGVSALRLAAIDLDGTLLAPDLSISRANREAVAKLRDAGLEVVLASGRHHDSVRPFASDLGLRWIISAQGGEASDVPRQTVLSRTFLPPERVRDILALQPDVGLSAIFYAPDEILTLSETNEAVAFYSQLTGLTPRRVRAAELDTTAFFKVVWIGAPSAIEALSANPRVAAIPLQQVRTHLRIYELMPVEVSKATGLAALARHLGLGPANAVVFGDADNDIPMFDWAAASFAMPHGWPQAKQRARWIAPEGPPESALARAVAQLLQASLTVETA